MTQKKSKINTVYFFSYLRSTETEKIDRDKERPLAGSLSNICNCSGWAGGQHWALGTHSRSPRWVTEIQALEPSSLPPRVYVSR